MDLEAMKKRAQQTERFASAMSESADAAAAFDHARDVLALVAEVERLRASEMEWKLALETCHTEVERLKGEVLYEQERNAMNVKAYAEQLHRVAEIALGNLYHWIARVLPTELKCWVVITTAADYSVKHPRVVVPEITWSDVVRDMEGQPVIESEWQRDGMERDPNILQENIRDLKRERDARRGGREK